jgi:hypothetical protein
VLHRILFRLSNWGGWDGWGMWHAWESCEMHTAFWLENLKERGNF